MFRRKETPATSIQRGDDITGTSHSDPLKMKSSDYPQQQRQRNNASSKRRHKKQSLKQTHSLDSLDHEEWGSGTDDERSVKSLTRLVTPEEREQANRRLQALEKRSMMHRSHSLTTMEASSMDLTSLIENQEWKHVLRKIGSDPRSIAEKYDIELNGISTTAFPLHHAVSQRPPLKIVDAMVAVFPGACRLPDDVFGQLPLHIACKFRASGDVLKCIYDAFPNAVRLTDTTKRRLPLHYACYDGYPNDVSMLIAAERRALTARDVEGKTPVDLCQESMSPHRDAILKRIYEVSKRKGSSSRVRQQRQERAPQIPLTPAHDQPFQLPIESPSDITVETSNVSKKPKSILPTWGRGRKTRSDARSLPDQPVSLLDDPRKGSSKERKRGSSLERLRLRRRAYEKYRTMNDSKSVPSRIADRERRPPENVSSYPPRAIETASNRPSPADSSSSGNTNDSRKKSRKKKTSRNREDSVPEIASSYDDIVAARNAPENGQYALAPKEPRTQSSRPEVTEAPASERASVPLNESIDEVRSTDRSAPSVMRNKKRGLAANSDLMKLLDQEEKEASIKELGHESKLLSLPFAGPPDKNPTQTMPASTRESENGHRSLPTLSEQRVSVEQNETGRLYNSMSTLSPSSQHSQRSGVVEMNGINGKKTSPSANPKPSMKSNPHIMSPARQQPRVSHETQVKCHHLQLRKASLVEECNHASESIMKKRARAQMSKTKISLLESQIRELQAALHNEKEELEYAESGIKVHEEILAEQEGKIKAVEDEIASLEKVRPSPAGSEKSFGETTSNAASSTAVAADTSSVASSSNDSSSGSSSDDSSTSSTESSSSGSTPSSEDDSPRTEDIYSQIIGDRKKIVNDSNVTD